MFTEGEEERLIRTIQARMEMGLPTTQDLPEHAARRNGSLVLYCCTIERRNIDVAASLGITAEMLPMPYVWRWMVTTQRGKEGVADIQDLWANMAGLESTDRLGVIRSLTECQHPVHGVVSAESMLPTCCRELVRHAALLRLNAAIEALKGAILSQYDDEIAKARAELVEAQAHFDSVQEPVKALTWVDEVAAVVAETESEAPTMVSTGLTEHDEHIGGGFGAGWLVVIMAPPKQGKTALAVNTIAAHTLAQGGRVGLVSLEMPRSQVIQRLLARESGVPVRAMNARDLTPSQRSYLAHAADRVAKWDLQISTNTVSMADIGAKFRALHREKPLSMGAIDYAQLVVNGHKDRREDIEETTRGAKLLAMELGIPILLLSQPNNTDAKDGTVGFYSGKGSGSISADCDIMLIPSRSKEDPSKAGLEIAGGRHAEPRKWEHGSLHFDGARMLFAERKVGW
jgi:hypothetical protein